MATQPTLTTHPLDLIRRRRTITGASAVLLPFTTSGAVDWDGFAAHVERTAAAGLIPAVNMDTGYANLIDDTTRVRVLALTRQIMAGREFIAGAYVADQPGDEFSLSAYMSAVNQIHAHGGTPILFQSYGLTARDGQAIIDRYAQIAAVCPRFIAFELGTMFAPFGKIYDLATFAGLMNIPQCVGAKHSSLRRDAEWARLILRDHQRPDFKLYTGNDLAVDMVMYGSDYLLGITTFAPDWFARRDALWAADDPAFYALNDALQYLGMFAFRPPVPAYRHSAAQFLKLRGWIGCDDPHPQCPRRPESDLPILAAIRDQLEMVGA